MPSPEKIQKLFADSIEKLQREDVLGAVRGFEKLAETVPESAGVWYNLGFARQHLGRHAPAADAYRRALKIQPDNLDAMVNLGLSQKELAQPDEAMRWANAALEIAANHPRALNLLGTLHAEKNEHQAAEFAFNRALESEPQNEDARHNLANSLLSRGDAERALTVVGALLENPSPPMRHRLLYGQILLDLKQYGKVFPLVDALTAEFGEDAEVMLLRMSLFEMVKDYFGVMDVARELLARAPDDVRSARVWNSLGSAYFQLDSVDKAAECYARAIELAPDYAEYQNNRGLAYSSRGKKTDAEQCYRRAIELNPRYAEAYRNLVAMKKFAAVDDGDARAIIKLWEDKKLDDFTRTKVAFALGKVYDDVGEYARAFETYAVGNKLKFAESQLDFDRYFAHIDDVPNIFTAPPPVCDGNSDGDGDRDINSDGDRDTEPSPIFIVGMPRSGTTLVEQILSRHPQVTGCGELPCIEKAIARMEKRAQPMRVYPRDFLAIDAQTLTGEAEHYLSWVHRLHELSTPHFTDKMPFNFVHIWLIKALFPDAAVVHCHRHPLDVITSNFFQLYASDISFVYDLEVLAKYYVRYYRLMRHWRKVFGDEIYTVQYETLIGDKETQTRELIRAAKLDWNDACLDLKKSTTAVRTASIWQVRQGIYTTSMERWRHYKKELAPAVKILQKEGVLDGELKEIG